jgi:hypothetical protein
VVPQPWPADDSPAGTLFQPSPGVYAISVNVLAGFLFANGHEDYLTYFRQRPPDGRAGYSILIYNVK